MREELKRRVEDSHHSILVCGNSLQAEMSQGRCSATIATLMVLCCLLVLHPKEADAATTYTVGDANGWTFNTESWTKGKRFAVGDTLAFRYNPKAHNVVVVDGVGYSKCSAPNGAKVYQTGNDRIKLVKGRNNFICSFPGHCTSGMRIAITV